MPFLHIRKQSLVAGENVKLTVTFLDSSHDKEHDDAQFLQIAVSMTKLQPLLNHCKLFMKCVFVLSYYNALNCRLLYAPLCRVFANRVTSFQCTLPYTFELQQKSSQLAKMFIKYVNMIVVNIIGMHLMSA